MPTADLASVLRLYLLAGNLSTPGAPMLQLALGFNPDTGTLNGEAVITQAVPPPNGHIVVRHVAGTAHLLGYGPAVQVLAIQGEFNVPLPPPAIGILTEKFQCVFVTDLAWHGHGTFTYGNHTVKNVPIEPAK